MSKQKAVEVLEMIYKHSKEGKDVRYVDNLDVKGFVVELFSKFDIR
ncbi:hypothetical protein [Psychroserpens algicola]|nr:hypothetical protein [Psychroserpens algicola]